MLLLSSNRFVSLACSSAILFSLFSCGGGASSPSGMPYWLQPGSQISWTIGENDVERLIWTPVNGQEIDTTDPVEIKELLSRMIPGTFQVEVYSAPYCLITAGGLTYNGTFDYNLMSDGVFDFSAGWQLGSMNLNKCTIPENSSNIIPENWQWTHDNPTPAVMHGRNLSFCKFYTAGSNVAGSGSTSN